MGVNRPPQPEGVLISSMALMEPSWGGYTNVRQMVEMDQIESKVS